MIETGEDDYADSYLQFGRNAVTLWQVASISIVKQDANRGLFVRCEIHRFHMSPLIGVIVVLAAVLVISSFGTTRDMPVQIASFATLLVIIEVIAARFAHRG